MNKVFSTIPELINMLKTAEEAVDKQSSKSVMVVSSSTSYKSYRKKVNRKKTISAQSGVSKIRKARCCYPDKLQKEDNLKRQVFSIAVGPVIGNTAARHSWHL